MPEQWKVATSQIQASLIVPAAHILNLWRSLAGTGALLAWANLIRPGKVYVIPVLLCLTIHAAAPNAHPLFLIPTLDAQNL